MTILEVYEKYKHLDYLLGDETWLPDSLIASIFHDLWIATRTQALSQGATQQPPYKLEPLQNTQVLPDSMDGFCTTKHPK